MYIDADDNGGDLRRETEMYIDADLYGDLGLPRGLSSLKD